MKKQNKNHEKSENTVHFMPIFMSIGIGTGVAIGAAMDNIPIGMSIGLSIGLCIGSAIDMLNKNKAEENSAKEDKKDK
jgi:F0F1-type ATP synthase assembly protein I